MNQALKDGEPTGRLNSNNTLMEIKCYVEEGTRQVHIGTRWIPITEEQRRQIISGNTSVVSVGYDVKGAQRARLHKDELSDGPDSPLEPIKSAQSDIEAAIHVLTGNQDPKPLHAPVKGYSGTSNSANIDPQIMQAQLRSEQTPTEGGFIFRPDITFKPNEIKTAETYLAFTLTADGRPIAHKHSVNLNGDLTGLKLDSFNLTSEGIGLRGTVDTVDVTREATDAAWLKAADAARAKGFVVDFAAREQSSNDSQKPSDQVVEEAPVGFKISDASKRIHLRIGDEKWNPTPEETVQFVSAFQHTEFNQLDTVTGATTITEIVHDHERRSEDRRVPPEHSGHNVNYYSVPVPHPKRPEREPYIFEVEDLIQALNLNFHEGTVLKSLVRSATERELALIKLGGDAIRDAEKMIHSSQEILRDRKLKQLKGK